MTLTVEDDAHAGRVSKPETTSPPRIGAELPDTLLRLRGGHDNRSAQPNLKTKPVAHGIDDGEPTS
jgi:hypothetical protein